MPRNGSRPLSPPQSPRWCGGVTRGGVRSPHDGVAALERRESDTRGTRRFPLHHPSPPFAFTPVIFLFQSRFLLQLVTCGAKEPTTAYSLLERSSKQARNQRYALRCSSNWTVQCCNSVAMHFEQFLLACILFLCTLVCMAREWSGNLSTCYHVLLNLSS
ncbi:hypothetical protein PAHAL_7G144100 [Panicum hallii]|uniref:Uncharacterized protein n=1 Tax=Panicum hallii TaxID=206008 RepID=A0A2T8IC91_9POAL|nr:hypothetical protein PAHAL_7G144100 [Panicum hallii]